MAKYSYEIKKEIVKAYLNGEGGYKYLCNKYNIGDHKQVQKWVDAYKAFGDKGLLRCRKKENYSFEFKLSMVELYLTSELTYRELAMLNGMNNPTLLANWVKDYRIAGPDALRPKKKGRRKTLDKDIKQILINNNPETVDTSAEHVKELEDELLRLRIENAFLKELRRLRLEDEAKMRDSQESSTVSEENLN